MCRPYFLAIPCTLLLQPSIHYVCWIDWAALVDTRSAFSFLSPKSRATLSVAQSDPPTPHWSLSIVLVACKRTLIAPTASHFSFEDLRPLLPFNSKFLIVAPSVQCKRHARQNAIFRWQEPVYRLKPIGICLSRFLVIRFLMSFISCFLNSCLMKIENLCRIAPFLLFG